MFVNHTPALPNSKSFLQLSDGVCHFDINSATDGSRVQTIVLVHGATVPMWEFDLLIPSLQESGCTCIQFDLFGHGYSDRPELPYTLDLFVGQLADLIAALDIRQPVSIIGHSLGAAVAAEYAKRFPHCVDSMILCAPLVNFASNLKALRLLDIPVVGELLMEYFVVPMLERRRSRRYQGLGHGHFPQMFSDQLLKPGYDRALLSLIRSGTLSNQLHSYEGENLVDKRTMLVRATEDEILTHAQFEQLISRLPHAIPMEPHGAGHAFILTHPDLVAKPFLDFLQHPIT